MSVPYPRRALPTETVDGLRPPMPGFSYFWHADRFRFEARAEGFSATNAWWLADASLLVYGDPAFIEEHFARSPLPVLGFQLEWLGTREENRGIVLRNGDCLVIVFRGTRVEEATVLNRAELVAINQDDLVIDGKFLPVACRAGGRVHRGFSSALATVEADIDQLVAGKSPEQTLWLTGHSLGGALATLAAAHLGAEAIDGLYTYGAPRVGNAEFTEALPKTGYERFVHREDWVPTVPPEWVGYQHGGTLHRIGDDHPPRTNGEGESAMKELVSAIKQMARDRKIDAGKLPVTIRGIADHAPIQYATVLWNSLIESSEACPSSDGGIFHS